MIGRDDEIALLREQGAADRSRLVVVYGRRRIGKTFLVREAFDYRFTFTFTGVERATLSEQLSQFHQALLEQGLSNCPVPRSWIDAFGLLKKLLSASKDERKIVFVDELPWMDTPKSRFLPAFENFWNGWCSARKDILLIVCGSATSWMVKRVLRNRGGLFNRANRTICLQPFTLRQCEEFAREAGLSMGRRELAEAYMAFGGVPYYWSLLDRRYSLAQNIDRLCFTVAGDLVPEFRRLYESVFVSPEPYMRVVTELGTKKSGMTREELSAATGVPNCGRLTDILSDLEQSGFVRSYAPFGKRKKGTVFQLVDNFSLFYFRFMRGKPVSRPDYWLSSVDSAERHSWEGLAFELVCLWHERQLKDALRIGGVQTNTASWRSEKKSGGAQIDLLLERKDGIVNLCEMKFSSAAFAISEKYERELRNKIQLFKDETGTRKSVHLTLVSAEGLRRNGHAGIVQSVVTLDDLFL